MLKEPKRIIAEEPRAPDYSTHLRDFITHDKFLQDILCFFYRTFSSSLVSLLVFHGSSRCTPYGRTPLTEFRTCGFPASGSLRNESFTLSFVYIDIYPGSYQWIAVIQHI